jgi:hypothetical protein
MAVAEEAGGEGDTEEEGEEGVGVGGIAEGAAEGAAATGNSKFAKLHEFEQLIS